MKVEKNSKERVLLSLDRVLKEQQQHGEYLAFSLLSAAGSQLGFSHVHMPARQVCHTAQQGSAWTGLPAWRWTFNRWCHESIDQHYSTSQKWRNLKRGSYLKVQQDLENVFARMQHLARSTKTFYFLSWANKWGGPNDRSAETFLLFDARPGLLSKQSICFSFLSSTSQWMEKMFRIIICFIVQVCDT